MKKIEDTEDNKQHNLSPSEFYRMIRPENFSDSENTSSYILTEELLAFELSKITQNQKENQFETLSRKMAEKLVAPNLIPQVGPTGGGDGKTDSETYPVSDSIYDRWFVPDNGWNKDEKWAIAISAKATWKSKLKSDIKSILSTEREYTRIYFITNQTPSSKKKKDAQDEFIKEFKIDIIILDGVWILENTYSQNLINLVVESLNLSSVYLQPDKMLGSNDSRREKELSELEKNVNDIKRYSDYDFQLVEDALQAAILSRQLEKPRTELEGKFDRVERLLTKTENKGQSLRLSYQKAWTYINYYDDYETFLAEFYKFKKTFASFTTISSIESYSTLITLLRTVHFYSNEVITNKIFEKESREFKSCLENIKLQCNTSSMSLAASMFLDIMLSFDGIKDNKNLKQIFKRMKANLILAENRLEFPFEQFQKMIANMGNVVIDSDEFDDLYDTITRISGERNSQMDIGQLYINRGGQKMKNNRFKEGLIYFGKAVAKLSKNESQYGFYLATRGLSQAYNELGLYNASYSSKIASISILLKSFFDDGNLDSRLLQLLDQHLSHEILYGRFPHILTWHELYQIIYQQFKNQGEAEEIEALTKFDAYMCIRLLNADIDSETLGKLPSILKKEGFLLAEDTSLFLLGHTGEVLPNFKEAGISSIKDLEEYYQTVASQPLNEQFVFPINFIDSPSSFVSSKILGTEFVISFETNNSLLISAETIIAYIEGFLGTSMEDLYPNSEKIQIELIHQKNTFAIEETDQTNSYKVFWDSSFHSANNFDKVIECCLNLISRILAKNFLINDVEDYLTDLFKNQEVNERLSVLINHKAFLSNVLGNSPRLTLKDWTDGKESKISIRKKPFIINNLSKKNKAKIKKPKLKKNFDDLNAVPHNKRKVITVIENHLWDKASWKGMGVAPYRNGIGLIIGFENIEFGEKIFKDWIERFGINDSDNRIKISIITEMDPKNPYWYVVMFSSNINPSSLDNDLVFVTPCRFHLMNASTNQNLLILKEGIKRFSSIKVFPGEIEKDLLRTKVNFELFIEKTEITFVKKSDIKENDIESAALINFDN
ncbi:hypothetical protein ACFQ3R_00215 [Mesonia ostreae]|uniref:Tetratricopeptide repeat protein n=1 Tax=Mesonia ostreae TaxID=861110 RepID=A0ABU2KJI9_9FLAO|nr:hypothetical protein [Mesonia ostreae]MDT0294885.1 hypothetical protein [Mesonia ostreae]